MDIKAYSLSPDVKYFPLEKAPVNREWMDKLFSHKFPYRCLPMVCANSAGWLIRNPISFSAIYHPNQPDYTKSVELKFDELHPATRYFLSHFGANVLTLTLPWIFRTPENISLWVRGLPNNPKRGATYLEGIVETYFSLSFTFNILITEPEIPIRFEKGEPLMFFHPFRLADLEMKSTIEPIESNPELLKSYQEWSKNRAEFNASNQRGPLDWEKTYYKGIGCPFKHYTKTPNEDFKEEVKLN